MAPAIQPVTGQGLKDALLKAASSALLAQQAAREAAARLQAGQPALPPPAPR